MSQVGGTHPPLFHVLMNLWISWFGVGETAIRSFALVFGVLSIPLAYWVGTSRLRSPRGAHCGDHHHVLAVQHLVLARGPHVHDVDVLRVALGGVLRASRSSATPQLSWAGYFAASLAGAFTHYLFLFLILGQVLYFVLFEVIDRVGPAGPTRGAPGDLAPAAAAVRGRAARQGVAVGQRRARGRSCLLWMQWAVFFPPGGAELVGAVTNERARLWCSAAEPGHPLQRRD